MSNKQACSAFRKLKPQMHRTKTQHICPQMWDLKCSKEFWVRSNKFSLIWKCWLHNLIWVQKRHIKPKEWIFFQCKTYWWKNAIMSLNKLLWPHTKLVITCKGCRNDLVCTVNIAVDLIHLESHDGWWKMQFLDPCTQYVLVLEL